MCLDLLSVFQQLLTYIAVSPHISLEQMAPFTLLPPVPSLKGWGDIFASLRQLSSLLAQHKRKGWLKGGGGGGGDLTEMQQWIIMLHNMPHPSFISIKQQLMEEQGTLKSLFLLSRTRGSRCLSTPSLSSPSKRGTPHSSKNMLQAYLWYQLLCWRKCSFPAALSKTGWIGLRSSSLLPSPHLHSAAQPDNLMMITKCFLIVVDGRQIKKIKKKTQATGHGLDLIKFLFHD